jgi:hypothetical protein
MFIKWFYNDHGHGGYKELEIPDDLSGEESVEEYICALGLVPTWSERFMMGRIKWEKIDAPSEKFLRDAIGSFEREISWKNKKIAEYKKLLNEN